MKTSLTTLITILVLGLAAAGLSACGGANVGDHVGGGGVGDTIGGDEHTGEPVKGEFAVTGTWDLSSPISADRTVGDAFADALVLKLAEKIPSESAVEKVDAVVRPVIKREVDGNAPEALRPDSELMRALTATLASVEVLSELQLQDGGLTNDLRGTERIVAFGFSHDGQSFMVTPDEITQDLGVHVEASWAAQAEGDGRSIDVENHRFELRFGDLVLWLLTNVLEQANAPLVDAVTESLECQVIVGALLDGREGLFVEVGGREYGFDAQELGSHCETARGLLVDRALGMFALDAKVEVGGTVTFLDDDGDDRADRLISGPDYGGFVGVAPEFIAPRLSVSFEATRVE